MASLNVGSFLQYHAAVFIFSALPASRANPSAHTVISENNPSSAGVVRRMARSDHCRCVSTPRWARTSWNVISTRQRETNQLRMCRRGLLRAERRNRGYTLYHAASGAPVARLRQTGKDDRVEVLYWSLWKERWTSAGPFGRTI